MSSGVSEGGKGNILPHLAKGPRIEFFGNRAVNVDGCRGVGEYSQTLIRLNISGGSVIFSGTDLHLSCLWEDEATVSGNILSMEFCL